ncbi:MAG: ankyrin repeat domain-containing protein [Legionella sp.]|nr:ankyrin repeat domain-containing protein [Legionella sp.]
MSELKTPISSVMTDYQLTPFPAIGELIRFIARAFDVKNTNKKLDNFAQDFNFNWFTENEIVEDGIYEPIKKFVDKDFADWLIGHIGDLVQNYKQLVLTTNIDVLRREDILQPLINDFFAAEVLSIMRDAEREFDFPYAQSLANNDKTFIALALRSFSQEQDFLEKIESAYASDFKPDCSGADRRTNRLEQFRDWLKGKNIPDLISVRYLAEYVANQTSKSVNNIMQSMLLARSLDWTFAEIKKHNFSLDFSNQLTLKSHEEINYSLQQLNASKGPLTNNIRPLFEQLLSKFHDYKSQKSLGDLVLCKDILQNAQELVLRESSLHCAQYRIDLFCGRFYVMQGQPETALKFFETAFTRSLYRAGSTQKEILRDLLSTAAYLEDKACLKKHKGWGLAFGIYPKNKFSEEKFENWELKELKLYFYELFPKSCLFLELGDCYQYQSNAVSKEELDKQALNIRSPNKKVQYGDKLVPQLLMQASLGNFENVKKLLEHGADVNKLDFESGGGSALLNALQNANQTYLPEHISIVCELLKYPHSKETLNSLTDIKRLSILFEAIRLGKPDIVKVILDMGANPNLRAEIDNQSPLDYCIQQLYILKTKDYWKNLFNQTDHVNLEDLARITRQFPKHMFEKTDVSFNNWNGLHHEIKDEVTKCFEKNHRQKHSEASLYEILQLLLIHGANPNNGNPKNYGVTPLMFAAEVQHRHMFELLIKYKGDVYQPNSEGRCALDYLRSGIRPS